MTMEKSSLYTLFRRNNLLNEFKEQEPVFVWNQVAGEVGKIARPKKVKGDTLVLEVPSAAAKQELSYLEDQFLNELNDNLEETEISKLKFELGRFPSRETPEGEDFDLDEVSLSEEEYEKIEAAIEKTDLDRDTAASLKELLVTQQKKRKVRLENGWNECPSCGGIYPGEVCPYCGFGSQSS